MQEKRSVMSLDELCNALRLPNNGSWDEIPSDIDANIRAFWRTISVDVHIQHPGLGYFAYIALFLVRGFLVEITPLVAPVPCYIC
jgi:hypothetical protein